MAPLAHRKFAPTRSLVAFFVLAFGISWSFWIPATALGTGKDTHLGTMLIYAGIAGPLIAACLLLYSRGSSSERWEFWRRIYEVERLGPRWLVAGILIYPLFTVLAVGLDYVAGGLLPDTTKLYGRLHNPVLLLASLSWVFLLGPILEEPGWRGYALDRLQALGGAFTASVILGLLWATWHLPQFFVPGTYHRNLGFATLAFWLFVLTAVSISVLIAWIYFNNQRSTFAAILFHASVNFTRDSVPLSDRTELIRTGLVTFLAIIVVLRCRPDMLTKCG